MATVKGSFQSGRSYDTLIRFRIARSSLLTSILPFKRTRTLSCRDIPTASQTCTLPQCFFTDRTKRRLTSIVACMMPTLSASSSRTFAMTRATGSATSSKTSSLRMPTTCQAKALHLSPLLLSPLITASGPRHSALTTTLSTISFLEMIRMLGSLHS